MPHPSRSVVDVKRLAQSAALAVVIGLTVVAPAASASAAPSAGSLAADTNDFSFESFDADYYLGTDADGRSTLTTVETFVALFPESDQNHGMKRAIPLEYQGAPTGVSVQGVTDGDGNPRSFTTDDDDGALIVTSREDGFVHGPQTYVFTYTQSNVTRYFADRDDDEFYWDTNGLDWDQPFGSVTARVHVPTDLAAALTGDAACYQGAEGASDPCEIAATEDGDGTVFTATASDLSARQNVTVAIGFEPHTFVPRDDSYFGTSLGVFQTLGLLTTAVVAVWAFALRRTKLADGRGRPTIIAEYAPPSGLDLITAAVLVGKTTKGTAAALVDLAVRRRIRIVETEPVLARLRKPDYRIELLDATGVTGPQRELLSAFFGSGLTPGSDYLMGKGDAKVDKEVQTLVAAVTAEATASGLRKKIRGVDTALPAMLALLGAVATTVLGVMLISDARGGPAPVLVLIAGIVVGIVAVGLVGRKPLTGRGAELRDHLKGLELYIRLAEADRLRVLQSPTGAEREAVSTADPRQVLVIYEKLLPYAVLFGLEKEWAEVLGTYYLDTPPEWYSGSGTFNAAIFASSIGSMSSAVSSAYSGSSSSGGSGGGGSSGGGGGGGGGGGV